MAKKFNLNFNLQHAVSLCLTKNNPFVFYSRPNNSNVELMVQRSIDTTLEKNKELNELSGFLVAPFSFSSADDLHLINPDVHSENVVSDPALLKELNELNVLEMSDDEPYSEPISKAQYVELIQDTISRLDNNSLPKIVISRTMLIQSGQLAVAEIFENILQKYSGAFTYLLFLPSFGIWMGATPESLIHIHGSCGFTMALAGTKKDNSESWTTKEYHEHQFVVHHIQEILKQANIPFKVEDTTTVDTGTVQHLCTKIGLSDIQPKTVNLNFLQRLHPTPAVCGNPVHEAKKQIEILEKHSRELYCGFLGPVTKANLDLYVNLRCMKRIANTYQLYLGGGITQESIPENEWHETTLKARTLQSVLG